MTEKIAIYGGTFNPPHIAHVRACEAFYNAVKPDRLLVIPDFLPPHKEVTGNVTSEDRLAMTALAFESMPYAQVSDMEIRRGGRSYTAITLSELKITSLSFVISKVDLCSDKTFLCPFAIILKFIIKIMQIIL